MEIAHLKAFVTIAAEGNLTRSAKLLYLTQPALSAQISGLEKELGLKLFHRNPKGMTLSLEGENLLGKAKEIISATESFSNNAQRMSGKISGLVNCSYNIESSLLHLVDLVTIISDKAPDLMINFFQVQSQDVPSKLHQGEMGLGFCLGNYKHSKDIDFIKLSDFHVGIIAPLEWKQKLKEAKEQDFYEFPWIFSPGHCPFKRRMESFIERNKLENNFIADHEDITFDLVAAGKGLAFVLCEQAELKKQSVYLLEGHRYDLPLNLYYRKDVKDHPASSFVIDQIESFWDDYK